MVISLLWFRSWPRDCDAVERPFASTSGVRPYVLFEGRIYKLLALCKHSSLEGSVMNLIFHYYTVFHYGLLTISLLAVN